VAVPLMRTELALLPWLVPAAARRELVGPQREHVLWMLAD